VFRVFGFCPFRNRLISLLGLPYNKSGADNTITACPALAGPSLDSCAAPAVCPPVGRCAAQRKPLRDSRGGAAARLHRGAALHRPLHRPRQRIPHHRPIHPIPRILLRTRQHPHRHHTQTHIHLIHPLPPSEPHNSIKSSNTEASERALGQCAADNQITYQSTPDNRNKSHHTVGYLHSGSLSNQRSSTPKHWRWVRRPCSCAAFIRLDRYALVTV